MKKVFYLFNALTLILLSLSATYGKPLETKEVEPIAITSAVAQLKFQTSFDRANQLSYLVPTKQVESITKKHLVTTLSVKQDNDTTTKKELPLPTAKPTQEPSRPLVKVSAKQKNTEPKGKVRTFILTAYTAGEESTGKSKGDIGYGETYSGAMVKEGITAACPRSMPIGTKLYIPDLGHTYTCQDRGGAITEGRLDIYIADLDEALDFGRQKLQVYVDTM